MSACVSDGESSGIDLKLCCRVRREERLCVESREGKIRGRQVQMRNSLRFLVMFGRDRLGDAVASR